MKTKNYLLLPLLLILCAPVFAQNWQIVWQDEFTSGVSADWVFETGTGSGGWGNNELEYYRRENATVSNGQLVITAKREAFGGMQYTSARMKTQGKKSWKFGKIEARIAMPSFQGVWPAFWMLGDNIGSVGWPACGELDIMEHVNTGGTVYGTAHWSDPNNNYASYGGNTTLGSLTAFHNYWIEWDASLVKWFVDGVKYHEINIAGGINGTGEFSNNFFILLNLAIGGNWPGFTVDNNAFPANMYVDYVRVYQNTAAPTGPVTVYQDCNYGGTGVALPVGSYTLSALQARGIANDWVSSVKVQSGYQVRLYQNDNYGGTSVLKTADDACLVDDNFNDQATSIVVSQVSASFTKTVEAESYSAMAGVQTEGCSEGGLNVGWIDTNDWMAYNSINVPTSGTYLVEFRVASPSGGRISMDLNAGATVLGAVNVPVTGGWQNWATISFTTTINAGTYNFGVFAATGGFNLNWWRITKQGAGRIAPAAEPAQNLAIDADNELNFYPNPANGEVNVPVNSLDRHIRIINSRGDEVYSGKAMDGKIDLSSFPAGIYTIQSIQNNKKSSKRLVKN
jgi:beta-glucanase (GH16 family)